MTIVASALKFRAKPIEFEAVLFDGSNAEDVIDWVGPDLCEYVARPDEFCPVAFDHHRGGRKARRQGRLDHQGAVWRILPAEARSV
jgi:hypothetical protein